MPRTIIGNVIYFIGLAIIALLITSFVTYELEWGLVPCMIVGGITGFAYFLFWNWIDNHGR